MFRTLLCAAALGAPCFGVAPTGASPRRVGALPSVARDVQPPVEAPDRGQTLDRLIRLVGAALREPGAARERILLSLRRVRDPRLEPVFAQLVASTDPRLRAHGVLGLAELDPERGLDMLLVRRIDDPVEQAALLGQALREGLLAEAQLTDVARWLEADPTLRAIVLGRALRQGDASAAGALRELATSESLAASTYACLALAEVDPAPARLDAVLDRVLALGESEAAPILRTILAYAREEGLGAGRQVCERVLASGIGGGTLHFEAVWTGLIGAPGDKDLTEAWLAMFDDAPDEAASLRMGVALLDVGERGGASMDARLAAQLVDRGGELYEGLGTGVMLIAGGEAQRGAERLASLGYAPAGRWALAWGARTDGSDVGALLRATIDAAGRLGGRRPSLFDVAGEAATLAAEADPTSAAEAILVAAGAGDEPMTRALLLGVLEAGDDAPLVRLPETSSWPGEDSAALASLLRARGAGLTSEGADDQASGVWFDRLASIALGDAPVSEPVRVQAAWLAIRCASADRVALTRMLAEVPN